MGINSGSRDYKKKRAIEKAGFIKTCKAINKDLLDIFKSYSLNDMFAFWIIKKNGMPGVENSEFVVYDRSEATGTILMNYKELHTWN